MTQFNDYTIKDVGRETKLPIGYQAIKVHVMYDVKHYLLQYARIVSGGHITEVPKAGSNSVVTSLFSLHIVMLFVELNDMKLFGKYILKRTLKRMSVCLLVLNLVSWMVVPCLFPTVCMDLEVVVQDSIRTSLTVCGNLDGSSKDLFRFLDCDNITYYWYYCVCVYDLLYS